jgi:hypothetical protein
MLFSLFNKTIIHVIYIIILSRSINEFEGPNLDADEINYCMIMYGTGWQKDKEGYCYMYTHCWQWPQAKRVMRM